MKKLFLAVLVLFTASQLWAQDNSGKKEDRNFRIPLIGEKAPHFTADATTGVINFPEDYGRHWKILFSHPQDFTPVCSSEILELGYLQDQFDKLNTKLVVVSTDPVSTHIQWKKALEELNYKDRGTVKIKFPLVDDEYLTVAKEYGMIHAPTNSTRDVRGVFIIDPDDVIQAIYFYPMKIGRNTEELIRTVTALQVVSKNNVLTPADWKAGNDVLVPYLPAPGTKAADETMKDIYKVAWFMTYKKLNL
ncbi:MAG: peroxiredoxin [Bacteroidota bacterium]|nr:peroxiredoxin [Bacteroidota bacterium]